MWETSVTNPPFVNKTALNLYVGDEAQITASPSDAAFQWSSNNEDVASVSQSGVVTAIGEGLATISVASENDKTDVDVRVRIFIPLTDINLPVQSVKLYVGDKAQLWAYPVPEDASEVVFTWTSADPNVATVDKTGMITTIAKGITTVTVSAGGIEKVITVSVPELYQCDKTEWQVLTVSDADAEGGGKDKMIDSNYATNQYWHSKWQGGNAPLPHWAVIDMKEQIEVARTITLRTSGGDTKTLQYFVSDDPDPNAGTWIKVMEGAYASKTAAHSLQLDATESVSGQYLKLILPDSWKAPFTSICEIDVFGLRY